MVQEFLVAQLVVVEVDYFLPLQVSWYLLEQWVQVC